MFPFHRKHGNSNSSHKQSGKSRTVNRDFEENEMSDEKFLEYIHNNDNSRHQLTSGAHDRYCNKILREKEEVLLSALEPLQDNGLLTLKNEVRLGSLTDYTNQSRESVSTPSSPFVDKNFLYPENNFRRKSDASDNIKTTKKQNTKDEYILTLKIDNLVSDMEDISFYRIGPKRFANECCSLNENLNTRELSGSLNDLLQINDNSELNTVNNFNFVHYLKLDSVTNKYLRKLLIGSKSIYFSHQWLRQCFNFCHIPASRWRLVQIKPGSCGVIAAVEAFLIKTLLFEHGFCKFKEPLRPNQKEVSDAFVHTLSYILWQAGNFQKSVILIPKSKETKEEVETFLKDETVETFFYAEYSDFETLKEAVAFNMKYFTCPPNHGYLNFIVCVIMSRGIYNVQEDMDDEIPFITENGHCSLELVMLLITGRAVSNVFNNDIQIDSCLLKGVKKQADVGFLSLFEHMNTCQVGSYLKSPKYPVWLVNCTNHFTVLFSTKLEYADQNVEQPFVLYHYDSMTAFSCQSDIKLVIDPVMTYSDDQLEDKTYLQRCIRTKWKNAAVIYAENSELFLV